VAPQHAHIECQDLVRALARLPHDQREVLLLVGFQGFSYREVAEVLSIPLGTVMSRLSRGRAALRIEMGGPMREATDERAGPQLGAASSSQQSRENAFVSD
jgi:RNA polymerase sigma-70 factor (ECF subfamily)